MKTLVALIGPTAVGKTDIAIQLAERFDTPIVNVDSRQIYRELKIGTASPTAEELQRVQHFFVGSLSISDYYNAARYEEDALKVIENIFKTRDIALLSGGSMLYVDAVVNGIDEIPTIDETTRTTMRERLETEGLEKLLEELKSLDAEYYAIVDHKNIRRIVHALEICHISGNTYTSFRVRKTKQRPFKIIKIGLQRPRQELYDRINARVDKMVAEGFIEEARALFPQRGLNALNTVGYNEMFKYFNGEMTLEQAVEKIKRNTRVYAKKQITWYKRDETVAWFSPTDFDAIINFILKQVAVNS